MKRRNNERTLERWKMWKPKITSNHQSLFCYFIGKGEKSIHEIFF